MCVSVCLSVCLSLSSSPPPPDLSDHGSVDVHDDDLAVGRAKENEFVIGSPDATSDVSEFKVEHRGPVTLTSNGTHQYEPVPTWKRGGDLKMDTDERKG